ncbi:MAG: elongation factor EF-2 [Nitrospiraceae bacterium]|nr:elongation factor EF-2 [Nitrospiraceae bacterium]
MANKNVEKVKKLVFKQDKIRNIAICAHIDHGKTTLSDNLLAGAGMLSEDLAGKQLALDFHEDEKQRGITIDSASVSMTHNYNGEDYLINLIDTPGHVDFGGDVTRAMRAVDGSVVLVDAVEGIMPQTETVLRQSLKERVKPILFINKVDRLIKELKLTPEKMQEQFIKIIVSLNKHIQKLAFDDFMKEWDVKVEDGTVCFGSAFHNWALSIPYMKEHKITFKDIIEAYEKDDPEAIKELARKSPLHDVLLNSVIEHLPSPKEAQKYRIPKIWHGDLNSPEGQDIVNCKADGVLSMVITKIVVDPQAGEIATGRIFSGTVKKGQQVYIVGKKIIPGRIQQVYIYEGAKKDIVDELPAGNIAGISGLKSYAGDTISTEKNLEAFETLKHVFEPVITKSIEAKNPSDLPKLIEVLKQIEKEDPSLKVEINEETGEYLISGMGELHLDVTENRIKKEKNVDIITSPPIVVYRETVTKKSEIVEGKSPNKHNKLKFKVEPLSDKIVYAIKIEEIPEMRLKKKNEGVWKKLEEFGMSSDEARKVKDIYKGNILVDGTRGIVHIGDIMEMVLDMFEDVMNAAPLAREPAIKMKVTLVDATLHEDAIHRGPSQIYPTVRDGIRGAIRTANPVLYEPIQTLRFEIPEDYIGEVSKIVSNKRGQLIDMKDEAGMTTVIAKLPVAEMFGLSSELRSATSGRGTFFLIDQDYEQMPRELQDKVIEQIRTRKGLKVDNEE